MKWFKHYTDASRSEKLAALVEKTGLEGYARYWLLVEFLAEKFDGTKTEFLVNRKTLGRHLGYYRPTMAQHWLDIGHTLGLFQVSLSGHCQVNDDLNYLIVFPKLLEIKDNHTKNLQVTSKLLAPRTDKKRTDKNRIESKQVSNKICTEFIALFNDNDVIKWLSETGSEKIHKKLLENYNQDVLREQIFDAYNWQLENKARKAGTFLKGWMDRCNNPDKISLAAKNKMRDELDERLIQAMGG